MVTTHTKAPTPRLSICIAVYRRHSAPNLATLVADLPEAADGIPYETVVVLNGLPASAAGTTGEMRTISFRQNQGVPIAWNAAARASRGETLVVVNDDVRLGPGSLRMLVEALDGDPDMGVAGPVGTRWDLTVPRHLEYIDTTSLPPSTAVPCEVLSGFLLATPRATWEAVGGFEEAYTPCGFEEIDYCTAVRLNLNKRCCCIAGVPFEHEFGISAERSWRRIRWDGGTERLGSIARRNRAHFQRKWSRSDA
jgi:GT2 family glycosyltransferase